MSDTREHIQSELVDLMSAAAKRGRSLAPRNEPAVSGHCNIVGNNNTVTVHLSLDGGALAALLGLLAGKGAQA